MRVDEILASGFRDFAEWVNPPVARRADLSGEPVRVARVAGGCLVLEDGRVVEDFHGTQAFGHRHPQVTRAVRDFLDSDSASWFPARVNPYAGSLARRLGERSGYDNAFFAGSGSEAVEAALKLSRAATGRARVLGLSGAYHGCTMGSCALMADGPYREPFAPHLPSVERIPFGDVAALESAFAAGDVAGVIAEPIQLEGGVRPLSAPFLEALCALTARHGALLVADEVQTGLGRTGRFLASMAWPRRPEAVLLAKHLGGGLLPISAMLTRAEIFQRAYGASFESSEAHNLTFSGTPAACVAAHAALDILDDALVARVGEVGRAFRRDLSEALAPLPLFDEVRGDGLAVGIVLKPTDHPWLSFESFGMDELADHPTVGLLLCHRLYRRGFFCFVCGHDWRVLRLQPRFTIEPEKLAAFTTAAREELEELCNLN